MTKDTEPRGGFYKKQPLKPRTYRPTTAREAVALGGDDWRMLMDFKHPFWKELGDKEGPDWRGAASMRMMERGELPRISVSDVVEGESL